MLVEAFSLPKFIIPPLDMMPSPTPSSGDQIAMLSSGLPHYMLFKSEPEARSQHQTSQFSRLLLMEVPDFNCPVHSCS